MQSTQEKQTFVSRLWHKRADLILGIIFLWITLLYTQLMLKDHVPLAGWVVLAALWLVYTMMTGRLTFATPLDLPIMVLLSLSLLSLVFSWDAGLSLPKVYGLGLGIALFYLVVNAIRNYQYLNWTVYALVLLAMGVSILGLLAADWTVTRFGFITASQSRFFSLLGFSSPSIGEVNVNTVGGALAFFIPFLVSLFFDGGAFHRKNLQGKPGENLRQLVYKLFIATALLLVLGVLLMTGSRGAILGGGLGLLALAVWKDRRFLWLIPVLIALIVSAIFIFANGDITEFITILDTDEEAATLAGRLESWRNSVYMIQDFPLTGAGIGTASKLFQEIYAFNPFPAEITTPFQPHNLFLSIAIDLGIPALVAYVGLLSGYIYLVFRSIKIGRSIMRVLLMGLACGLLAHQVFGIMDAFLIGTKLGAIQWIFLGLGAAAYVHRKNLSWKRGFSSADVIDETADPPTWAQVKSRLSVLPIGLAYWLLISLAAVTFINFDPILSLTFAVAGGIYLGMLLTKQYRKTSSKV